MNALEPTISAFSAERHMTEGEGLAEVRQSRGNGRGPRIDFSGQKPTRKRQMEVEFLHHKWVAPARQQVFLPFSETGCASSAKFGSLRRCPKCIEALDERSSDTRNPRCVARGCQSQERADPIDLERPRDGCGGARCKTLQGHYERFRALIGRKPKRRFQRTVKPVFTRCGGDLIEPRHFRLWYFPTKGHIPAKPRGPEVGQRTVRGQVVDCEARV